MSCVQNAVRKSEDRLSSWFHHVIIARLPAGTIFGVRLHVPEPKLSEIFSVKIRSVKNKTCVFGSCTSLLGLLGLLHWTRVGMLLI